MINEEKLMRILEKLDGNIEAVKSALKKHKHDIDGDAYKNNFDVVSEQQYEEYIYIDDIDEIFEKPKKTGK